MIKHLSLALIVSAVQNKSVINTKRLYVCYSYMSCIVLFSILNATTFQILVKF